MIVTCVFAIGFFSIKRDINSKKNDIDSINKKIAELQTDSHTEKKSTTTEEDFHKYYIELSDKADDGINKLLTIVGIFATTYTVFGAVFIFKAPREIEKKIDEIDKGIIDINTFVLEAKNSAEEAMNLATEIKDSADEAKASADKAMNIATEVKASADEAKNSAKEAKDSKNAAAYHIRGVDYANKGDYDKAIEDFNKAIKLDENYAAAYYNRGNVYADICDNDKAIEDYTKAIELDEKDASAYFNRGVAYADKGDYNKAIKDYNKAIELDENDAYAYNNRGIAYEKLMEKEKDGAKKEELRKLMEEDFKKTEELKGKGQ